MTGEMLLVAVGLLVRLRLNVLLAVLLIGIRLILLLLILLLPLMELHVLWVAILLRVLLVALLLIVVSHVPDTLLLLLLLLGWLFERQRFSYQVKAEVFKAKSHRWSRPRRCCTSRSASAKVAQPEMGQTWRQGANAILLE